MTTDHIGMAIFVVMMTLLFLAAHLYKEVEELEMEGEYENLHR